MKRTERWQVRFTTTILGVTAEARLDAQGPWLHGSQLPKYVCDQLGLRPFHGNPSSERWLLSPHEFPTLEAVRKVVPGAHWYRGRWVQGIMPIKRPAREKPIVSAHVDLKSSIWTQARGEWEHYKAGEVFDMLRAAFNGKGPEIVVHSLPRDEAGHGTVKVSKGQATVTMRAFWGPPACHIPDSIPKAKRSEAVAALHAYFDQSDGFLDGDPQTPIAAYVARTVRTRTFQALMRKIDSCEVDLRTLEKDHGREFVERVRKLAAELR